jgi:hypothetical protein
MPGEQQEGNNGSGVRAPEQEDGHGANQNSVPTTPADEKPMQNAPADDGNGSPPRNVLELLFNRSVDFSKSGLFFIILGCGFLYFAYHVLYHVHPTFVFILALLGLSIVLFGTGTQSLGSGEFDEPGSQAKAKFYLAGGAGVLAGLFGFGAVLGSDKIERVFSNSSGYALVVFEITNPAGSKLHQATVRTNLRNGQQLPVLVRDTSIEVLAPVSRG